MTDFTQRLAALRARFTALGYDGYLVPMADEYQSEYVPPSARRVAFLTGFTGSAGFVAVLKDKAAFFTDGRYTLQAEAQVPAALFAVFDAAVKNSGDWLAENLGANGKIAFDPWLHSDDGIASLKKRLAKNGIEAVAHNGNLVDDVWAERPAPPAEPVTAYDLAYAGKSSADKRREVAADLAKDGLGAAVITDTASVAWLLNVRGGDVANTPLPLSFAILDETGQVDWFLDPRKITDGLAAHIGGDVRLKPPEDFAAALDRLAAGGKKIRLNLAESAHWIAERLRQGGGVLDNGDDPSALPRACKNAAELDGMRAAHRRDGAALSSFLAWLDRQPHGSVSELDAEKRLGDLRAAHNLYRGPSFDTIAGSGPHGAIVHYRATDASNRKLEAGELFLLDSGGQYLDGTTDVTRTVAIGEPGDEMRDRFTRVLKGHIGLASIRFPDGTSGAELEILARQHLWAMGLDYNHGTGHGVGSYLGVHEGPQGISKRNKVALKPGMVLSNEPGYYKTGAYGIRIENLQTVVALPELSGERVMLGFEPLTLAPIDLRLIDDRLMSRTDWQWLDAYHRRVYESLGPLLSGADRDWLRQATSPSHR